VLIGWDAEPAMRTAMGEALAGAAIPVYLPDLAPDQRGGAIEAAEAVISFRPRKEFSEAELARLVSVKLLQTLSAGVNQLPFDQMPPDLRIACNAGAYAEPMAEHAMAMALAAAKALIDRHHKLRRMEWDQFTPTKQLRGGVCAILGLGGIGRHIVGLARAFGMRVHAINRSGQTDVPVDFIGTLDDLEAVLRAADVIMVTIGLNRATLGLLDARRLAWTKDDAILVNVARGDIIDEHALYAHLKDHPRFIACLDAWWIEPIHHDEFRLETPLLELANLIGSPHNSAQAPGALIEGARRAAVNVRRLLDGGEPLYVVTAADRP